MAFNIFEKQSNGTLVLSAVLQTSSIVWEEGFNVIGKLQAVLPKSSEALSTVKVGCFATVDTSMLMYYIYGIRLTDDELWAYGYECKALLQKQQYDSIIGRDNHLIIMIGIFANATTHLLGLINTDNDFARYCFGIENNLSG